MEKDKTALGISEELRQFVEAVVEEVILGGKPFDEKKKRWLQRYSEIESMNYDALEKALGELFKTAEEIKCHENTLAPAVKNDILGWPKEFLEQFLSAYCKKDIGLLKSVFSPNSQIITGAYVTGKEIRYRLQKKQQYLTNLRYIFSRNKTIDVSFEYDDNTGVIYESKDGRCQIIRIIQHWHSNHYNDRGYISLFLYLSHEGPEVFIRAWRPIES